MDRPEYVRIKYQTLHKNSLRNVISRNESRMDGFIIRLYEVDMAYRSKAGLPMI